MSARKYRSYEPNQDFLLPLSLKDWLPSDHLAYFIVDIVQILDLNDMYRDDNGRDGGRPAYDPKLMVSLLLYAYCVGVYSSRKIEKATYESIPFRVVSADQHPDHDTIAAFRKEHLSALSRLFLQVLRLCQEANLVKLGHVALDGTKVRAQASKHKAMSYGRVLKKEEELKQEVAQLLERAEKNDTEEDELFGSGVRGDELPEDLRSKQERLLRLQEAKEALEQRAKEKALRDKEEQGKDEKPGNAGEYSGKASKKRKKKAAEPKTSSQYNFTDPDSRLMVDKGINAFVQSYNCQSAVDEKCQIIVAAEVTQEANDKRQLDPMLNRIIGNCDGKSPKQLTADEGYFSTAQITAAETKTDLYVAVESQKRMKEQSECPRGRIPKDATIKDKMARKLSTKAGKKTFSLRKQIAEPVFGQIKEVRGFRQFFLRGFDSVRAEWDIVCTTHNLLKLHRLNWKPTAQQ